MIHEFHSDPETTDVHAQLAKAFGDGEISGDGEFTTNWGGIFKFELEQLDIGTSDVYYVWVLTAYLDKGKTDANDQS